jgi:hypothetical protein
MTPSAVGVKSIAPLDLSFRDKSPKERTVTFVCKMTDLGPIAAYPSPPNYQSPPGHKASFSNPYDNMSMSPDQYGKQPAQGSYSGGPSSSRSGIGVDDKSPLGSMNMNFLKTLTDKRTTRGMSDICVGMALVHYFNPLSYAESKNHSSEKANPCLLVPC